MQRNRHNRYKGKPHAGGPVPIGLKRNADGTYFVDPHQAEIVQFMKARFFADHSTTHLPAALLVQFGVKTTSAGLRLWFKSPLLRGHIVHGWKSKKDYGPSILNAHEAIITSPEAALIDSVFAANLGRTGKNSANKVYPLNKQMTCGRCGGKACIAVGGRHPNKKAYVICDRYRYGFGCLDWIKDGSKRPPSGSRQNIYDRVEAEVIIAIQGRAQELAAQASSNRPAMPELSPEVVKLQIEVAQAEVQSLSDPDYQPVLQSKRKKLDAALNAVNAPEKASNFEAILAGLETPAAWAAVEPIVRRHLYEELVEQVLVWPDRTEVTLAF